MMLFLDDAHRDFYEDNIQRERSHNDPYRQALFYTLGLTDETRRNINSLYNYRERCIKFEGLFQGWQTGTTRKVTQLAFNLFNGFMGDTGGDINDEPSYYCPENLFATSLMPYFFEAVKLRHPLYFE